MLGDVIRIFIGSEPYMRRAELALESTIRKVNKHPVEIVWMDYSRGGLWAGWDIGREYGRPAMSGGWGTDFSNYRFSVPEASGFKGRAMYMDVDFLVLSDLWEIWTIPLDKPIAVPYNKNGEPDTSLILCDCSAFQSFNWWPSIQDMKVNRWSLRDYVRLLKHKDLFTSLKSEWYSMDGAGYNSNTVFLHYSDISVQPWEPYAHGYKYPPYPRADLALLWWRTYAEALEQKRKSSQQQS